MSADCTVPELLRAYREPTSLENRTILLKGYDLVWRDTSHGYNGLYEEFRNNFTKASVRDLDKELVMEKPGLMPCSFPGLLQQGQHWAPMRQIAAKGTYWTAKNPIRIRAKISRYDAESFLFETDEQIRIALERDVFAFKNAIGYFWEMFFSLCLQEDEDWKKLGATKTDGTDGINAELYKLYFPTDGTTKGYQSFMQDMSIEKNFLCWKDGEASLCCKQESEDCKPFTVITHPIQAVIQAIRKCIKSNKKQATKATLKGYESQGSADYAKWIGLIQDTKKYIMEAMVVRTSKFNIGMDMADANKLCSEECQKLLDDHGINLGCCKKCVKDGEEKCCCYNQTIAEPGDIDVVMNFEDFAQIQQGFPLMAHPNYLENLKTYLGVNKIWLFANQPSGEILVINKKTLGWHPVGETKLGSAKYDEADELTNIWIEMKGHLVIYPFHCFTVTKPT